MDVSANSILEYCSPWYTDSGLCVRTIDDACAAMSGTVARGCSFVKQGPGLLYVIVLFVCERES